MHWPGLVSHEVQKECHPPSTVSHRKVIIAQRMASYGQGSYSSSFITWGGMVVCNTLLKKRTANLASSWHHKTTPDDAVSPDSPLRSWWTLCPISWFLPQPGQASLKTGSSVPSKEIQCTQGYQLAPGQWKSRSKADKQVMAQQPLTWLFHWESQLGTVHQPKPGFFSVTLCLLI